MKKYMVFLYTGMISALLDLDHVIMLIKRGIPITLTNIEDGTRLLHLPAFYIAIIYMLITIIIFMLNKKSNFKNNKKI